jgi:hypothetical protein
MTAATAEIASPAGTAGFLPVYVPRAEKRLTILRGEAVCDVAKTEPGIINGAVAGGILTASADRYITGSRAAWERLTVADMQLLQCDGEI